MEAVATVHFTAARNRHYPADLKDSGKDVKHKIMCSLLPKCA